MNLCVDLCAGMGVVGVLDRPRTRQAHLTSRRQGMLCVVVELIRLSRLQVPDLEEGRQGIIIVRIEWGKGKLMSFLPKPAVPERDDARGSVLAAVRGGGVARNIYEHFHRVESLLKCFCARSRLNFLFIEYHVPAGYLFLYGHITYPISHV